MLKHRAIKKKKFDKIKYQKKVERVYRNLIWHEKQNFVFNGIRNAFPTISKLIKFIVREEIVLSCVPHYSIQ